VDVTARGAVDVHGYPDCGGVSAGSPGRRAGRRRLRRIASPSPTSERSASSLIVDSVLGVSGERHYRDVGIVTDRARLASRIEVEAGVQKRTPGPTTRYVPFVCVPGLLDAGATVGLWSRGEPHRSPVDLPRCESRDAATPAASKMGAA
jgi:hypothetical protein